jgi:SH3-like domain-containing protein
MKKGIFSIFFAILLCTSSNANCIEDQEFLSTKFFKVSVRCAPSNNSQVKLVFLKKHEPVKILATFGNWKKIQDIENDSGWVHVSALSNKRFIIINSKDSKIMYSKPNVKSTILANLKTGVKCRLLTVQDTWCKVKIQKYQGWITKTELWGL